VLTTLYLPYVSIAGSARRQIQRSDSLDLQSTAYVMDCDGGRRKDEMGYAWVVSVNNTVIPSLVSSSRDETRFQLAGFQLTVGILYTITLTVTDRAFAFGETVPYSVEVEVLPSDLKAVVTGGASQSWKVGELLVLNGSSSYDIDVNDGAAHYVVNGNITHEWTCEYIATAVPLPSDFCTQLIASSSISSSIISVDDTFMNFNTIIGASFAMRLNVSGTYGRSDSVAVVITIRKASAASILLVSAPEIVLQHQPVIIKSLVTVEEGTVGQWTVDDENFYLTAASRMSSLETTLSSPGMHEMNLAIIPHTLSAGLLYQFVLNIPGIEETSMIIDVRVVEPPRPGIFEVTPTSGVEFTHQFGFLTSRWSGDNLPLSYSFGYFSSIKSDRVIEWSELWELQARSESTYLRSEKHLPRGSMKNDYNLTCGVQAFNTLGATRGLLFTVQVKPVSKTPQEFDTFITEELRVAALSQDVDDLRSVVSVGISVLNHANCSLSPADCSSLGRSSCRHTPHTCGPCLSGFVGLHRSLDGNSQCISSTLLTEEGEMTNNITCSGNADCKAMQSCSEGVCVYDEKLCHLNCSGHGRCEIERRMVSILAPFEAPYQLDMCLVNDITCDARCVCDEGFAGNGCSEIASDVETKQETRLTLLQYVNTALDRSDSTTNAESMRSLLNVLRELGSPVTELKGDSCTELQLLIGSIFSSVADIGLTYYDLDSLVQMLDDCDHVFIELLGEASSDSADADALSSAIHLNKELRLEYMTLAASIMVLGENNIEEIGSLSRLSVALSSQDDSVTQALPSSLLEHSFSEFPSVLNLNGGGSGSGAVSRYSYLEERDLVFYANWSTYTSLPVTVNYVLLSDAEEIVDDDRNIVFEVVLRSVVTEEYVTTQNASEWLFVTVCTPLNDTTSFVNFTCPDGQVLTHRCNSKYERYVSECPHYRYIPSCEILISNTSEAVDANCDVLTFTTQNVTCNCTATLPPSTPPSGRRLGTASAANSQTSMSLEVVTVSIVTYEFPLIEMHHIGTMTLVVFAASISVIVLFAVLWGCGLLGIYELVKDRYLCTDKVKPSDNSDLIEGIKKSQPMSAQATVLAAMGTTSLDTATKRQYMLRYVNDILPLIFRSSEGGDENALQKLWAIIKKHHRYAVMFTAKGEAAKELAVYKWLQLLTIQAMLMFVLAVFFSFQFPEDESKCTHHLDITACEAERSLVDSTLSECEWHRDPETEHGVCTPSQVEFSIKVIFFISVLSAATSAPFNVFVDVLFEDILSAPLVEECNISMKIQNVKNKKQLKRLTAIAGRITRKSIALTNTAIVPMFSRAIITPKSQLKRNYVISKCLNALVLPNAFMRQVPPAVTDARALLADILRDDFQDVTLEEEQQLKPVSKVKSRMTVVRMSMLFKKAVDVEPPESESGKEEGDDPENKQASQFTEFLHVLAAQGDGLVPERKMEFEDRWGYDSVESMASLGRLPWSRVRKLSAPTNTGDSDSSTMGVMFRQYHELCAWPESNENFILDELANKQEEVSDKLNKLKLAKSAHVGMEVLHLFVMDLLGRRSPAAAIFSTLTRADFKQSIVVTKTAKKLAWALLFFLNACFVFFSVSKGMVRSKDWQQNYLFACLSQIFIEVAVYQTIECAWIHFFVPRLILEAVDSVLVTIHQCIRAAFQKDFDRTLLNTPALFFVSWDLAGHFPHLFESSIVRAFQSFFPPPCLDRAGHFSRDHPSIFSFLSRYNIRALLIAIMLWTGSVPIRMQQATIHTSMPIIIAAIILLFAFLVSNPIFLLFPLLLVMYELTSVAYMHHYANEDDTLISPINDTDKNIRFIEEFENETVHRQEKAVRETAGKKSREAIAAELRAQEEEERRRRETQEALEAKEREIREKKQMKAMKKEAKKQRLLKEKEDHEMKLQAVLTAQEEEAKAKAAREAAEQQLREERLQKLMDEKEQQRREAQERMEREAWEQKEAKIQAIREQKNKERQAVIDRENHRLEIEDILDRKTHDEVGRALRAASTTAGDDEEAPSTSQAKTFMKVLGVQFLKHQPQPRPKLEAVPRTEKAPPTWEEHKEELRLRAEKERSQRLEKEAREAQEQEARELAQREQAEQVEREQRERERVLREAREEAAEKQLQLKQEMEERRAEAMRLRLEQQQAAARARLSEEIRAREMREQAAKEEEVKKAEQQKQEEAASLEKRGTMMKLLQLQARKSNRDLAPK